MSHMVGMIVSGMRRGVLLLVLILVLAACSETSPATTTASPSPTTVTTAPPTTTSTTTSTTTATAAVTATTVDPLARPDVLISNVNRDSIDDFDTSKDNIYEAAMELRDLFVFLEGNPTDDANDMVSLMFERDYPQWNPILIGFRELTDNPGWHYVDPGVETLGIELLEGDGTEATLRLAHRRSTQTVADADGEVVRAYDGWELTATVITFRRGPDGLWRYADLEPSEEISNDEILKMVPVLWTGREQ